MNKLNQDINKDQQQNNEGNINGKYINPLNKNHNARNFLKLNQEYQEKLLHLDLKEIEVL